MVTFAGDLDPEEITGRRDGAGPRHDRAERQVLDQVQAEGGIHVGVLQDALFNHLDRPAWRRFLAGLEDELDVAAQRVAALRQHARRVEQDGGVPIVAAGVHHAGNLGTVGHIVLLLDRQGVDIGA
jgi:hypothetical protein